MLLNRVPESFFHISKFQDDFETKYVAPVENFNMFVDLVFFGMQVYLYILYIFVYIYRSVLTYRCIGMDASSHV